MDACPSGDTLRMLGDDCLDPAVSAGIEDHIAECPACLAQVERLAWECPTPATPGPSLLPPVGEVPNIAGFTIEKELGRGSMGIVYLARQHTVGRQVALKVMRTVTGAEQATRKRWRKEATAFSSLRHPNVAALHDIGEVSPWLYLVLEYVPGRTLKDRLAGPLRPGEAVQLVATITDAVHHIHQAGILHLDLKPSNILIDAEPDVSLDRATPKVADFGIARILAHSEATGTEVTREGPWDGTPSYIAPEQLPRSGHKLCPATDVHALGAILYRLLTGLAPYQGATALEILDDLRTRQPVPPRQLNARLSPDLQTIILKCLQKDPGRRYPTARSLAEDLRRWLDGRPIQARPVPLAERAWRWCRRRPVVAGLSAALALTVLTSCVVLYGFYKRADEQRKRADEQREQAEIARESAERNLEVASGAIGHLEELVLNTFQGSQPIDDEQLVETTRLVTEQITKIRTTRGFDPALLERLSEINRHVGRRLHETGRINEARDLVKSRIDMLRECRKSAPGNEDYLWATATAFLDAGEIEADAMRPEEALAQFDKATFLIAGKVSANHLRQYLAACLSGAYLKLANRSIPKENPELLRRANDGQLRMLAVVNTDLTNRPDLALFKACVLADQGKRDQALALVETLSLGNRPITSQPIWLKDAVEHGLENWFTREVRHWDKVNNGKQVSPEALECHADSIVTNLARLCGMNAPTGDLAILAMTGALCERAAFHRNDGRLSDADRTDAYLMVLARRFVREFPNYARGYIALGQAHSQQAKNAWKRNDMRGVKQGLTASLEAFQRGLALDPDDVEIRRIHRAIREKLAEVPES